MIEQTTKLCPVFIHKIYECGFCAGIAHCSPFVHIPYLIVMLLIRRKRKNMVEIFAWSTVCAIFI